MGGQACVFYGAAEFSRDRDLIILLDPANLDRLRLALIDLNAKPIAVPDFHPDYLARGHAIHFRCALPDLDQLRLDVMSNLRGVAPFEELWARRTTIQSDGLDIDLLSMPDLVAAKKTQRDKDWPIIRRLVDQHYFSTPDPTPADIDFWLSESRSPEIIATLVKQFPEAAARLPRPVLHTNLDDLYQFEHLLEEEQRAVRSIDRAYWDPLKKELEQLRRNQSSQSDKS